VAVVGVVEAIVNPIRVSEPTVAMKADFPDYLETLPSRGSWGHGGRMIQVHALCERDSLAGCEQAGRTRSAHKIGRKR
jgi:hypothetical protein